MPGATVNVAGGRTLPCANQRVPSSAWDSSQRHHPLAGHGIPVDEKMPIATRFPSALSGIATSTVAPAGAVALANGSGGGSRLRAR